MIEPCDDQSEVVAFLSKPESYGPGIERVDTLNTHISQVFLAGDRAYKLKRAVAYPYLDFSTEPLRHKACATELALNRRTAPRLYVELRSIARAADGALHWGNEDPAVDWVVVMRRFGQDRLLAAIADADGLDPPLILALAAQIARFHASAEHRPQWGDCPCKIALENERCLRASRGAAFAERDIEDLRTASLDLAARLRELLDMRRIAGKVRRCHGDLHLRNICVLDGEPVIFDCLEFSDDLATIDVLYDLAFLVMDLEHRGHGKFANLLLNRYLDLTGDDDGLPALPLFLSLRAAIRAHVTATMLDRAQGNSPAAAAEARLYLKEACAMLRPQPRRLVAIGGLSGTGKSTLAARLAPGLGCRPGARVLRSDVIRKRLCNLDPETPLPESAYEPDVTSRVYDAIRATAAAALGAGYCVVIDAVALKAEERAAFAAVAGAAHVPFSGLWLEAPAETLTERIDARRGDASDATVAVVNRQLQSDPGTLDWRRIEAGGDPESTLAAAQRCLALDG